MKRTEATTEKKYLEMFLIIGLDNGEYYPNGQLEFSTNHRNSTQLNIINGKFAHLYLVISQEVFHHTRPQVTTSIKATL